MNIKNLTYKLYKIDWMRRISSDRQMDAVKDYYEGLADDDENYTFEDYIEEFGYDGELYVCFEEFLENEFLDKDYMKSLLDNKSLYKQYLKIVEEV